MNKHIVLAAVISAALVLSTLPGIFAHAGSSEQVVFSGTGTGTFKRTSTQFGFWIWCESDSSNPYLGECNGSMYFYSLHLVKQVGDTKPIVELSDGVYLMTVGSTDGSVACTLQNSAPPTSGPTNTVTVNCDSPPGSGTSKNAVVNVTGPG